MNNGSSRPFDEQAALERGKRLQEQIHEARRRRQRAVEEFDAFLRENQRTIREASVATREVPVANREVPVAAPGAGPAAPAAPTPAAPASTPGGAAQTPAVPAPTPEQNVFSGAQSALDQSPAPPTSTLGPPVVTWPATMRAAAVAAGDPARASPVRARTTQPDVARLVRRAVAVAAPIFLLVAATVAYRSWTPARDTVDDAPATPPAVERTSVPPTAAPPEPSAPPVAATATPGLELTTSRPAWVRVTVDDRVVVERELAAGQHLQFDFNRAVTVRAGDAGAVRLTAAGRDLGVMGPAGQIRTRTITAPVSEQ